ncbi:hypothetical protein PFISCL1PPCAC_23570, partial [Pristionchus fissidentatus]
MVESSKVDWNRLQRSRHHRSTDCLRDDPRRIGCSSQQGQTECSRDRVVAMLIRHHCQLVLHRRLLLLLLLLLLL